MCLIESMCTACGKLFTSLRTTVFSSGTWCTAIPSTIVPLAFLELNVTLGPLYFLVYSVMSMLYNYLLKIRVTAWLAPSPAFYYAFNNQSKTYYKSSNDASSCYRSYYCMYHIVSICSCVKLSLHLLM